MAVPTTKAERAQRIERKAARVVETIEVLSEYRRARDRVGEKPYQDARRLLVAALIDFGREVATAAVATVAKR